MMRLLFRTSDLAVNDRSSRRNRPLGIGVNTQPLDEGDWQRISPWGEFPHDKGLQIFGPAQGRNLVAAFNSMRGRLDRQFRGLPIFVGHPDVQPDKYPDSRRYGRIDNLEVRSDGLYGLAAWNDLGEQNRTQGYYIYPSPAWYFKSHPRGVEPVQLKSIGLTNRPNIEDSSPWSDNEEPDREPCKPTRIPRLVAYTQSRNPYAGLYGVTHK